MTSRSGLEFGTQARSGAAGTAHGEACTLNNLGIVQHSTGRLKDAAASHHQALELFRKLGRALEGLGQSDIHDGNAAEGASKLRQAFAIFQRLGVPDVQRVEEALRDLGL